MLTDTGTTFCISDALVSCIQISWVWDKHLLCYCKYSISIEILRAEYIQNISEKGIQFKQLVFVVNDWSHILECRNLDSANTMFSLTGHNKVCSQSCHICMAELELLTTNSWQIISLLFFEYLHCPVRKNSTFYLMETNVCHYLFFFLSLLSWRIWLSQKSYIGQVRGILFLKWSITKHFTVVSYNIRETVKACLVFSSKMGSSVVSVKKYYFQSRH